MIKDEDVKGKALSTLVKTRNFTKLDWVLYAQSLLEEKLEKWPRERDLAVSTAVSGCQQEIKDLKDEVYVLRTDLTYSFEQRDKLEKTVKGLQDELARCKNENKNLLKKSQRKESPGRPPKYDGKVEALRRLRSKGKSVREISALLGMSITTIHRFINKYGIGKGQMNEHKPQIGRR